FRPSGTEVMQGCTRVCRVAKVALQELMSGGKSPKTERTGERGIRSASSWGAQPAECGIHRAGEAWGDVAKHEVELRLPSGAADSGTPRAAKQDRGRCIAELFIAVGPGIL